MAQCPGVDKVTADALLNLTLDYLDSVGPDYICGNLAVGDSADMEPYNAYCTMVINAGRFINVPRTYGISTTEVIERVMTSNEYNEKYEGVF